MAFDCSVLHEGTKDRADSSRIEARREIADNFVARDERAVAESPIQKFIKHSSILRYGG